MKYISHLAANGQVKNFKESPLVATLFLGELFALKIILTFFFYCFPSYSYVSIWHQQQALIEGDWGFPLDLFITVSP